MTQMTPAIPPDNYTGILADWIAALNERGYDGENYTEVEITKDVYNEILDWCET